MKTVFRLYSGVALLGSAAGALAAAPNLPYKVPTMGAHPAGSANPSVAAQHPMSESKSVAAKPVAPAPMSAWRQAYVAKHHHQPAMTSSKLPASKAPAAKSAGATPVSAWRKAYVARHHHQPPSK